MVKLRHNKRRNCGLVYEFLTRELSSAVVASNASRGADILGIISKYLGEGSILHEELGLHRQIMESRGVSERLARRIVDDMRAAGIRLSARGMIRDRAKTDMIHEINRSLGSELFDRHRIPDYTAHASVGIILSQGLGSRLDESVEVSKVQEHLMAFLMSKPSASVAYDPDATLYAYNAATKLFENEIGTELDERQSDLLREYVKVSLGGNPAPFERTFEKHRKALTEDLKFKRHDDVFKEDKSMGARLDEAIKELGSLKASVDDESVERLMLFHQLRREIES